MNIRIFQNENIKLYLTTDMMAICGYPWKSRLTKTDNFLIVRDQSLGGTHLC